MEPFRITVSVLPPQGLGVSRAGVTCPLPPLGLGLQAGCCVTLSLWGRPWVDWLPGAFGCRRGAWQKMW